jgi:hypothetical protein
MAEDRLQWRALVLAVLKFQLPIPGKFLQLSSIHSYI